MDKKPTETTINIKKITSRILIFILLLIILMMVMISIFFTYDQFVTKDDPNHTSKLNILSVVSTSMYPKLNPGDLIVIRRVPISNLKVGDIISYYKDSIIVTHRIDEIGENKLFAIGDSNSNRDKISISYEEIIGKYVLKIPKGEYILEIAKNPFFSFIIFILVLLNISFVFKEFKK